MHLDRTIPVSSKKFSCLHPIQPISKILKTPSKRRKIDTVGGSLLDVKPDSFIINNITYAIYYLLISG